MKIRFFCSRAVLFALCASPAFLASCFGGSSAPNYPTNASVTVSPALTSLAVNATQHFTANGVSTNSGPYWLLTTSLA